MYFDDLEDQAGFVKLVGAEIERREGYDVLLHDAVRAVAEAAFAAGTIFTDKGEVEQFSSDAVWEIYVNATTRGLISTSYRHGLGDSIDLLEFGEGLAFLGFDRNEDRGNDETIIGSVDPTNTDELSRLAAEEMFIGAGATNELIPTEINFGPEIQLGHVRKYFALSIGRGEVRDLGISTGASETERNTTIDAYLAEIVPGYGPDEAGGMLVGDLLGLDDRTLATDLDNVEKELRAVKDELGERDSR
jgi:hypothetical protein